MAPCADAPPADLALPQEAAEPRMRNLPICLTDPPARPTRAFAARVEQITGHHDHRAVAQRHIEGMKGGLLPSHAPFAFGSRIEHVHG